MRLPHSEAGEGSAVLLLHAGIADRTMWDEHLRPLAAPGHRVVAVDLPGFGEAVPEGGTVAHWEDVVETMDALGIERAALLGSSFGASVALRVAALYPERVSALLLFAPGGVPDPDPSPELLAAWEAEEAAVGAGDFERAAEAVVSAWVRPNAPAEVADRVAAMQRRNYEVHAGQELEFAPDPLEGDPALLGAIDCPTLLAVGADDMADFRDAAPDLAARVPAASAVVIAGCGHLPPLEAPDGFRRLALDSL